MVKEKETKAYICPYCDRSYDSELDAEDCRDDCLDKEDIIEDTITKYTCEMCNKIYDDEKDAQECEEVHISKEDKFYLNNQWNIKQEKLKEIANHPKQTRLEKWKMLLK